MKLLKSIIIYMFSITLFTGCYESYSEDSKITDENYASEESSNLILEENTKGYTTFSGNRRFSIQDISNNDPFGIKKYGVDYIESDGMHNDWRGDVLWFGDYITDQAFEGGRWLDVKSISYVLKKNGKIVKGKDLNHSRVKEYGIGSHRVQLWKGNYAGVWGTGMEISIYKLGTSSAPEDSWWMMKYGGAWSATKKTDIEYILVNKNNNYIISSNSKYSWWVGGFYDNCYDHKEESDELTLYFRVKKIWGNKWMKWSGSNSTISEVFPGNSDYKFERIQGYIFEKQVSGTVPLYRYWNAKSGDHFYTTSWSELRNGKGGYSYEGIEGYIYKTQINNSVPLYRYWNRKRKDHFYTTSWSELGNGKGGYSYEGIKGYIHNTRVENSIPLFRYWNKKNTDHFYTTDWKELVSTPLELRYIDPEFYLSYPDLRRKYGNGNYKAAYDHWIKYGIKEGRRSADYFDVKFYLSHHSDLVRAYGATNYTAAANHWLKHGIKEGRQSSRNFSIKSYLNRNSDLRSKYGSTNYEKALQHWIKYGKDEGRDARP